METLKNFMEDDHASIRPKSRNTTGTRRRLQAATQAAGSFMVAPHAQGYTPADTEITPARPPR